MDPSLSESLLVGQLGQYLLGGCVIPLLANCMNRVLATTKNHH